MTPTQIMGVSGILRSLLVKENVLKACFVSFPEHFDSYGESQKSVKRLIQKRVKTYKNYFPLKHYNREDGVVFSKKECKTEMEISELLGYPCINDTSKGTAIGPLYIYAFSCTETPSMMNPILLTGIICKKYKNKKLNEMKLIAKKALKVFKKHASFLETMGIRVQNVGVLPHMIELKEPTSC